MMHLMLSIQMKENQRKRLILDQLSLQLYFSFQNKSFSFCQYDLIIWMFRGLNVSYLHIILIVDFTVKFNLIRSELFI